MYSLIISIVQHFLFMVVNSIHNPLIPFYYIFLGTLIMIHIYQVNNNLNAYEKKVNILTY